MLKSLISRSSHLFLPGFIIIILFCSVLFSGNITARYLSYPYDLVDYESSRVYDIHGFLNGGGLYHNPYLYPYHINPYTPVFYIIIASCAKLMRISSYPGLLILGRLLSLSITILCSVIIFIILRKLKYSFLVGLIGGMLFLGNPLLIVWGWTVRMDCWALLFSLSAILAALSMEEKPSLFYCAGIFCLLAFYTKISYISAALAIILYLLLGRRPTLAIKFILYTFVTGLLVFLWINYITQGAFYLNTMKIIFIAPPNLKALIMVADIIWWRILPLFVFMAIAIKRIRHIPPILKIYPLVSIAIAFSASFKVGAAQNYWLEPLAGTALLSAMLIKELIPRINKPILCLVVFSLLLVYLRCPLAFIRGRFQTGLEERYLAKNLLVEMFRKSKKEVLYMWSPDVLASSGRPVINTDWFLYELSVKKGICDNSRLISLVENKGYDYIVLPPFLLEDLSDGMRRAIEGRYIRGLATADYLIYEPMNSS